MEVIFTEHSLERTDGGEKSRIDVPKDIIKNIVKKGKGSFFWDHKGKSVNQIYNKLRIVLDGEQAKKGNGKIVTVVREDNPIAYCKSSNRYEQISKRRLHEK